MKIWLTSICISVAIPLTSQCWKNYSTLKKISENSKNPNKMLFLVRFCFVELIN